MKKPIPRLKKVLTEAGVSACTACYFLTTDISEHIAACTDSDIQKDYNCLKGPMGEKARKGYTYIFIEDRG